MKILIIENNNLPEIQNPDFEIIRHTIFPDEAELKSEGFNYDVFIHDHLSKKDIFGEKQQYDCIILPYSMSEYDYREFSGLSIGLHIRLTPNWKNGRVPILFAGPDDYEDVSRLSMNGGFLFTPMVFCTKEASNDGICAIIKDIVGGHNSSNQRLMSDEQYATFLRRTLIREPENYDTHHSIANKWAAARWHDIMDVKIADDNFRKLLFFKYREAKHPHQKPKPNEAPRRKYIGDFSDAYFCYIDDQFKDWENVLTEIFKASGNPPFEIYRDFKADRRDELVQKINAWIDEQEYKAKDKNLIPIYILDMRLHESDSLTKIDCRFSGMDVLDHIKGRSISQGNGHGHIWMHNPGSKVIIFTASNKSWNMQKMYAWGADAYVIKEPPEHTEKTSDSTSLFGSFKESLKKCYDERFHKKYLGICAQIENEIIGDDNEKDIIPTLIDFEAQLISKDSNLLVSPMILSLAKIIEHKCSSGYYIDDRGNLYKGANLSTPIASIFVDAKTRTKFAYDNSQKAPVFFDENPKLRTELTKSQCWPQVNDKEDPSAVTNTKNISVLKYEYRFKEDAIIRYYSIRDKRNTIIAHIGKPLSSDDGKLTMEDIRFLFESIICKLYQNCIR